MLAVQQEGYKPQSSKDLTAKKLMREQHVSSSSWFSIWFELHLAGANGARIYSTSSSGSSHTRNKFALRADAIRRFTAWKLPGFNAYRAPYLSKKCFIIASLRYNGFPSNRTMPDGSTNMQCGIAAICSSRCIRP